MPSDSGNFEPAVDAIIAGDLAALASLLQHDPELVQARSTFPHRSTLLHYVSANGVEESRQKTPQNIVEITRLLLDAGADVNAESEAYDGGSTALRLTATSCHPEKAGVQIPLLALLLDRGAIPDLPGTGSDINACLHNGRGEAAQFLATRGARLDLEGGAGVGRLDLVRQFVSQDGSLKSPATVKQLQYGFAWACEFGQTAVVDFLLSTGIDVNMKLPPNGQTALHWAAFGGHADLIQLLLQHGALIDALDDNFGATPLGWALYRWSDDSSRPINRRYYYEAVALLARAGAKVEPQWQIHNEDPEGSATKIRSDARMQFALRGATQK